MHSPSEQQASSISRISAEPVPEGDHSGDLGEQPGMEWLPKDWLYIDFRYQRLSDSARSQKLIRNITKKFHWSKFQPITVAEIAEGEYAGHYAVIDGQHRALAALAHPLVKDVPCYIVKAAEVRNQADAFVGINRDRVSMQPLQLYRAQLAAGDVTALRIDNVMRDSGVTFAFDTRSNQHMIAPPRQTLAVSTIRKLILRHGEAIVVEALKCLAEAFPDTPDQLRGQSIAAITQIVVEHKEKLDRARLVKILAERDFGEIIEAARAHKELMGTSTVQSMAAAIIHAYDRGLVASRRLNPNAGD